jgi:hypothetical protein
MNIRFFSRRGLGLSPTRLIASRPVHLGLICFACLTNNVFGQFMLSPITVDETGLGTFSEDITALTNLINQSGLRVPFVNGSTDFDTYFAPPNSNFSRNADGTKWQSEVGFDLPLRGTLDFDLGDTFLVSKVALWNISVENLTVLISADPGGPWLEVGTFPLVDQQSSLSLRANVLDLGGEHAGRYVRLSINSEFPAIRNGTFGYVTIGEVVVRAAPGGRPTVGIARELNGDITIQFTGTLQVKSDLNGTFIDVPGHPIGTYSIPKEVQVQMSEQVFRARN